MTFDTLLFTFHYVSISTKYTSNSAARVRIYIPLCIYFNRIRSDRMGCGYVIYIPLCIYFNLEFFVSEFKTASIYIPLCIYFNHNLSGAPCHYLIHLHSTMYLFQLVFVEDDFSMFDNLHSTMYLFQPRSSEALYLLE